MDKPVHFINGYVLDCAKTESVARRIHIYNALAEMVGDKDHAKFLKSLAADLESIERRCQQLRLDLGNGHDGAGIAQP